MTNNLKLPEILYSFVKSKEQNSLINSVKMQKVIFILDCQINHTEDNGWQDIFKNKEIEKHLEYEAWQYGPVNTFVYSLSNSMTLSKQDFNNFYETNISNLFKSKEVEERISNLTKLLISKPTNSLVEFTHEFNEWKEKYNMKSSLYDNKEIDFEKILAEYKIRFSDAKKKSSTAKKS